MLPDPLWFRYFTTHLSSEQELTLAQAAIRGVAGDLEVVVFDGAGNLLSHLKWSNSSPFGSANAVDCVLHELRSIDTSLEQWHIDRLIPQKYLKWKLSTPSGAAAANDLVKSVERQLNGNFLSRTFENDAAITGQILTEVGQVVSDIGGTIEGVIASIGNIFHGWHW